MVASGKAAKRVAGACKLHTQSHTDIHVSSCWVCVHTHTRWLSHLHGCDCQKCSACCYQCNLPWFKTAQGSIDAQSGWLQACSMCVVSKRQVQVMQTHSPGPLSTHTPASMGMLRRPPGEAEGPAVWPHRPGWLQQGAGLRLCEAEASGTAAAQPEADVAPRHPVETHTVCSLSLSGVPR